MCHLNYGFPACEIKDPGKHGIIILELSSYQLDSAKKISLDLATITNITKDHLDYHETFKNYKFSKLKIINFLKENGTFILDADDKFLNETVTDKNLKSINIIKTKKNETYNFVNDNDYLQGAHNASNSSIAVSIAKHLNIKPEKISLAVNNFKGLPHRMEPLYISNRIKIINDSKSTNGVSTAAALKSFENIYS